MNSSKHITEVNPDDRANKEKRIHISHLDGLRGLAALYVVAYHAYEGDHLSKHGASSWLYHILGLISFGQAAVAVFIVLSGYCLMMPAIQKNADYLTGGGILDYIKRRAKRILPPYYAAGALSLLLIATIPGMDRMSSGRWSASLPAFHWDILVSHLFLIHNLNYYWLHKIDYPMWSVATEWQIYFIFPLVLLPVWRRFGIFTTVCTAIIIGIAPHWLVHGKIDGASFEFIGLFAFGMAGAVLSFSNIAKYIDLRTRIPWGIITLVLLMPIAFFAKFRGNWNWSHSALNNVTVGLATMCFLIYCANSLFQQKSKSVLWVVKILQARPCVTLGSFSYSLYLIHAPVLALVAIGTKHLQVSPIATVAISLLVAVPLSIGIAYLFFLVFERPFLVKHRNETPAEVIRDSIINPAP